MIEEPIAEYLCNHRALMVSLRVWGTGMYLESYNSNTPDDEFGQYHFVLWLYGRDVIRIGDW